MNFSENAVTVSWAIVNNHFYKLGFAVQLGDANIVPKFGLIKHIFIENNKFSFILAELDTLGFSEMFQAYEICLTEKKNLCLALYDLISPCSYNIHYSGSGQTLLSPMSSVR